MSYTDRAFLDKLKPYVIKDMETTGILASLTAAQAFIESNKGNSGLTVKANNLFGIKGTYNGESVRMLTTEYYNGVACKVYANFRKYPSWAESISDHSSLFNRLHRYANLRGETDYVKACTNVRLDGYATSPTYTTTLINTIKKYSLDAWDREVLGDIPATSIEFDILQPTIRKGDRGDVVKQWQTFLNANGYQCGIIDGIFGKNTELAVKQWQAAHGLTADGIIGPKTWASIK